MGSRWVLPRFALGFRRLSSFRPSFSFEPGFVAQFPESLFLEEISGSQVPARFPSLKTFQVLRFQPGFRITKNMYCTNSRRIAPLSSFSANLKLLCAATRRKDYKQVRCFDVACSACLHFTISTRGATGSAPQTFFKHRCLSQDALTTPQA